MFGLLLFIENLFNYGRYTIKLQDKDIITITEQQALLIYLMIAVWEESAEDNHLSKLF